MTDLANNERRGPLKNGLVVQLRQVSKYFGGLQVLTDVSVSLEQGRVLGLIGPNGAGKTTLLNVISGLLKPEQGAIEVNGTDVTNWPAHRISSAAGVTRTFQNIRLFQGMTVAENVMTGYHAKIGTPVLATFLHTPAERREEQKARQAAARALEFVGVYQHAARLASELSYGDQRRVEIARALVSAPTLLLLDEPTAGMTPRETTDMTGLIRQLKESNLAMIVIEHKANFIMDVSDRIVVLNFGLVIAEGDPHTVRNNPEVIEAYLGKEDDGT